MKWVLHVDPAQSLSYFKSSMSKWLGRLMSNYLYMDTSMNVAEMYAGLLNVEQTYVSSAGDHRLSAKGK